MDTSETYIKMSDCPEIQGDCSLFDNHSFSFCSRCHKDKWEGECGQCGNTDVWLPRQDQLQEMLYTPQPQGYGYDKLISLKMFEWATEYNEHYQCRGYKEYPNSLKSMEQLWLAFVMKEKYGKVWDGSKWQERGKE